MKRIIFIFILILLLVFTALMFTKTASGQEWMGTGTPEVTTTKLFTRTIEITPTREATPTSTEIIPQPSNTPILNTPTIPFVDPTPTEVFTITPTSENPPVKIETPYILPTQLPKTGIGEIASLENRGRNLIGLGMVLTIIFIVAGIFRRVLK